jgi:hypothetical protein
MKVGMIQCDGRAVIGRVLCSMDQPVWLGMLQSGIIT